MDPMKVPGSIVALAFLVARLSLAQEAPAAAPPAGVAAEIDALKKDNQSLKDRLKALEDASAAKPPAGAPGMTTMRGFTLKFGGDIRLRNEQDWNAFDLDSSVRDNANQSRLRTRLAFDADYMNTVGAYVKITNEYRWGSDTKYSPNSQAEDVRVDNAFIRLRHPFSLPIVFTGGRQDLLADPEKGWGGMYGEGWILFEGTPQDGSTTIGFDSVKLRYDGIENTTIDLMYANLSQTGTGTSFPAIYSNPDNREDFLGVYAITKPKDIAPLQLDLYQLNRIKELNKNYATAPGNFWDPKCYTAAFGGRLSSGVGLGTHVTGPKPLLDGHLDFALEGAYETGHIDPENGYIGQTPYTAGEEVDRSAWAGYAWARLNDDKGMPNLLPWVVGRFDFFSGDDPESQGTYEGWDNMYSDWPKYSELLIYTFYDASPMAGTHGTADPNLGVWTNMYFPTVELGFKPSFGVKALDKKIWFRGQYRYMAADENNGPGDGYKVGDLLQAYVEYDPLPFLLTHFYFDYFIPGDYYSSDASDAWFSRFEIMILF